MANKSTTSSGAGLGLRTVRAALPAALLALACAAVAQPAGNPRGSMAPGIGEAPKPVPSTGPMRPERAEGPLQSGPAAARTQRTEVPGGGTAGGLSNSAAPLGSASQRANESGMTNGAPQIRSQPPARP